MCQPGKKLFLFFCQETKVGESDWHIIGGGGGGVAVEVGDGGVIIKYFLIQV